MRFSLMQQGVQLGVLQTTDFDQPWFNGIFEAAPAFEEIRPLFAEELRLLDQGADFDSALWESAYSRIAALDLCLMPFDGGNDITDFLLHIDGREAQLRY